MKLLTIPAEIVKFFSFPLFMTRGMCYNVICTSLYTTVIGGHSNGYRYD